MLLPQRVRDVHAKHRAAYWIWQGSARMAFTALLPV
jgi:hypothetical protein